MDLCPDWLYIYVFIRFSYHLCFLSLPNTDESGQGEDSGAVHCCYRDLYLAYLATPIVMVRPSVLCVIWSYLGVIFYGLSTFMSHREVSEHNSQGVLEGRRTRPPSREKRPNYASRWPNCDVGHHQRPGAAGNNLKENCVLYPLEQSTHLSGWLCLSIHSNPHTGQVEVECNLTGNWRKKINGKCIISIRKMLLI